MRQGDKRKVEIEMTQQEVQKGWTGSLKGVIVLNVMSSYTEDKVGLNIKGVVGGQQQHKTIISSLN